MDRLSRKLAENPAMNDERELPEVIAHPFPERAENPIEEHRFAMRFERHAGAPDDVAREYGDWGRFGHGWKGRINSTSITQKMSP